MAMLAISSPVPASTPPSAPPHRASDADGLVAKLLKQFGVPSVIDAATNQYGKDYFLTKDPPQLLIHDEEIGQVVHVSDLPPGTDPQTLDWDKEGNRFVVSDTANGRWLFLDVSGQVIGEQQFPLEFEYPTGGANGFELEDVFADFGPPGSPGSLWYGGEFGNGLLMPGSAHPNGVDVLPDAGEPSTDQIVSKIVAEFLVNDAENGDLIRVTDAATPSVIGTVEGPAGVGGVSPSRDVAVVPVLIDVSKSSAVHPILMSVPALHQVFYQLGTNGEWLPLFSNPDPAARPVRLAVDCDSLVTTDFSNGLVTFYELEGVPKEAACTEIVRAHTGGRLTKNGSLPLGLDLYADVGIEGSAVLLAEIDLPVRTPIASYAVAKKRIIRSVHLPLTFSRGQAVSLKLGFSRRAKAALKRALEDGKLKGRFLIQITSPTGEQTTVTNPFTLRPR